MNQMSGAPSRPSFTPKQGQYLAFIYAYTRVHRRPPAEADMQRHFRVTPPSVHQMVLTLERAGLIRRQPGVARSIELLVPPEALPSCTPNPTGQISNCLIPRRRATGTDGQSLPSGAPTAGRALASAFARPADRPPCSTPLGRHFVRLRVPPRFDQVRGRVQSFHILREDHRLVVDEARRRSNELLGHHVMNLHDAACRCCRRRRSGSTGPHAYISQADGSYRSC